MPAKKISRRDALKMLGATTAGAVLASCTTKEVEVTREVEKVVEATVVVEKEVPAVVEKVVTATPAPLPEEVREAPMLHELVEKGELPPLDERLPEDVLVVAPHRQIGQYGGTWHRVDMDPGMGAWRMILYEPLVRWSVDYSTSTDPGLAKGWDWEDDGRKFNLYLRRGLKWSDGEPFTADDIMFWWEDLALNEDFATRIPPFWMHRPLGVRGNVVKIDDYHVQFQFEAPHWIVPNHLSDGFWESEALVIPKHFLSQYHPRYNDSVTDYTQLEEYLNYWQHPEVPTIAAWKTVVWEPGTRCLAERNPYYYKVDTEGNQLPYIDYVDHSFAENVEVVLTKVISGEVDLQFRNLGTALQDVPLLLENQERGNYKVIMWENTPGSWPAMLINWDHKDPVMRELIRDQRFRRALAYGVDRPAINETMWLGLGRIQGATISWESPHFQHAPEGRALWKEWAAKYAATDLEAGNRLLDEMGLTERDGDGYRLRPDGETLQIVILCYAPRVEDVLVSDMVKEGWEQLGIKTIVDPKPDAETSLLRYAGDWDVLAHHESEFQIYTYPDWVFPTRDIYWAPLSGKYYQTAGAEGEEPEPGDLISRLWEIYERCLEEPDPIKRHKIVWEGVRIHIDEGPFTIGTVGGQPDPVIARPNIENIPDYGVLGPWQVGGPGNTNPPQYFYKT